MCETAHSNSGLTSSSVRLHSLSLPVHSQCLEGDYSPRPSPYLNSKLGKYQSEQEPRSPALAKETSFSFNPANKQFCSASSTHNNVGEKRDQVFAMSLRAQFEMKEGVRKHSVFLWFAANQTMTSTTTLHEHCLVPSCSTWHTCSTAFLRILHENRANS